MYKIAILFLCIIFQNFSVQCQDWKRLEPNQELPKQFSPLFNLNTKLPTITELNGYLFLPTPGGIFRSSNQGEFWEYKSTGLNIPGLNNISSLCKLGFNLFAITKNLKVVKSVDYGESWEIIGSAPDSSVFVYPQIFSVQNTLYLFMEYLYEGGGVYSSADGKVWKMLTYPRFVFDYSISINDEYVRIQEEDSLSLIKEGNIIMKRKHQFVPNKGIAMRGIGNYMVDFSDNRDSILYLKESLDWMIQKLPVSLKNYYNFFKEGNTVYANNADSIRILTMRNGIWVDSSKISFTPKNLDYIFKTDAGLWGKTLEHLFFLANGSTEWVRRDSGVYDENYSNVFKFKNILCQIIKNEFYISNDGTNWRASFPDRPHDVRYTNVFTTSKYIFMQLSYSDTSYLYKSQDGDIWVEENITVPKNGFVYLRSGKDIAYLYVNKGFVYDYQKKYFSQNGGETFQEIILKGSDLNDPPIISTSDKFAVFYGNYMNPSYILSSSDGIKWDSSGYYPVYIQLFGSPKYFYLWSNKFSYPSRDVSATFQRSKDARNWTDVAKTGLPIDADIHSITPINDLLFACLEDGGIYVSKDFGDSWKSIQANLPSEVLVENFFMIGNELFASTSYHGLWKSDTTFSITSILKDQSLLEQIIFYPNPASNRISTSGLFGHDIMYIYNSSGVLVSTQQEARNMDISDLLPGLYFVKTKNVEQNVSGKFVKQ